MAITFHNQPPEMAPAGNALSYVFSSNQVAQVNFTYIVEVYVNNIMITRSKVFPSASGRGQIDTHDIVQRSIQQSFISTVATYSHLITAATYVKVYENYGTPPTNQASSNSNTRNVFNGVLPMREWMNTNIVNKFKDKLFFSDNPKREWLVHKDKNYGLCMYTSNEMALEMVLYDITGNVIESYYEQFIDEAPIVGVDPSKFNFTNINEAVMLEVNINQSENAKFKFTSKCDYPITVSWINKYGCCESWAFTHNMDNDTKIESYTHERQQGSWVGNSWVYDANISGVMDYAKVMTDSGTIYTGNMSDEMANWLQRELKESPAVFFCYGDQDLRRVRVVDVSYSEMNSKFDSDLPMVALKFEHQNKRKSINL